MPNDIEVYRDCMLEVRDRINLVQTALGGHRHMDEEAFWMHFRKVIEGIGYALLAANREGYAAKHPDFVRHDKAKEIIKNIEAINPDYYPIPVFPPREIQPGQKVFDRVPRGFLTRDEFFMLYSESSGEIHKANPYAVKGPKLKAPRHDKWVKRIQTLLKFHAVRLYNGDVWVVSISETGPVSLWPAAAIN